ncbi:DUF3558 domain-containing protein [Rhodococcus sp. D2-41]|nr:DUF3558 domain-containing protein [Rhodococcus sp. D2-41]
MRTALGAAALVLLLACAGCSHTVTGSARPSGAAGPGTGGSGAEPGNFRNLLQECKTVPDQTITQVVGGSSITNEFFGAICRWSIDNGTAWVTFHWFERGTLATERATTQRLGYAVADSRVSGVQAITVRPHDDPSACGVTTMATDAGVIGWWVQYRADGRDPCAAAQRLAELSLNRNQ